MNLNKEAYLYIIRYARENISKKISMVRKKVLTLQPKENTKHYYGKKT